MSFYTALTGLNGSQSDISATSNNIANVNTTGFDQGTLPSAFAFTTYPLSTLSQTTSATRPRIMTPALKGSIIGSSKLSIVQETN